MKSIARFVRRDGGDEDGLLIGNMFKQGAKHFKPGYVYEIQEILGELVIKEVGKSCIPRRADEDFAGICAYWASDISNLVMSAGKYLILTIDEMAQYLASTHKRTEEEMKEYVKQANERRNK